MVKCSIVIPVYNACNTVNKCIESILKIKRDYIELILVDDGSTDNSGEICDRYLVDSRVKVIHKKNEGCAAARNSGLAMATGKYVLFGDSDDYYVSKELERFLDKIPYDMDKRKLVCFNFKNVWLEYIEDNQNYPKGSCCLKTQDEKIDFISSKRAHSILGYAIWNKLYSRELIEEYNIKVVERDKVGNKDDWTEDLSFNLQYFLHLDKIEVVENSIYALRKHGKKEEQTERHLTNKIEHMIKIICCALMKECVNNNVTERMWEILIWHLKRYFYIDAQYLGIKELKREVDNIQYSKELKIWISIALQNWNEYGTRWDEKQSKDYKILLEYLMDGNLLKYRMKSKLLWRN